MTIKIVNAYTQRGWDSCSHLIDDSRIRTMIGRRYADWRSAARAADRMADRRGYAAVEYVDLETGDRWLRGREPSMPGREPLNRRVA